jgi:hypothetical protein
MRRFAPVRQKKLGADGCHCWPEDVNDAERLRHDPAMR